MLQSSRTTLPDFETWMTLAKEDPVRFEALRLETIDEFIAQVPEDKRLQLRRLQWRIDRVRERAGTPLAACVALSRMMWDSFTELRECYQEMLKDEPSLLRKRTPSRNATVLTFVRPQTVDV
ncbi:MAG: DUF3135 domain-containing protein [Gammaproteobacteria bacterium]|nr:DUF3135 domain-containing protein [Gammaproteobacteria bacterium]